MSVLEGDSKWLEHILDTIDEGIHAVDLNGSTLVYNAAAARMDGLSVAEVLGRHVLSAFPSLGPDTSTLLRVLSTGRPIYNRPQTYTNFLGATVHTVNTTLPILSQGRIVGALEIAKDLTQVKKLSEQVLQLQALMVGGKRRRGAGETSQLHARYYLNDILTQDEKLNEIKRRAEKSAQTFSPILVYGETGTGKELLVQAIHNAGPRQDQAFLALNCAAIPTSLLEGMLFGTVKGSFTGAEDRAGLFELADGGTLFLDEVQSLPLELQAKLLRVLQEGEVMRVGDTRVRRLRVRVVTAMNQRPEQVMAQGGLRQDLYYRINVVRFDLPPLRNRPQDIEFLSQHFIDHFNRQFGTQVQGLSQPVRALFRAYPWPGNVRELENAVEAALNLVNAGEISIDALPNQLREWAEGAEGAEKSADNETSAGAWIRKLNQAGMSDLWNTLGASREEAVSWKPLQLAFERIVLERAWEATDGNVSLTAQRLGLPRQTLQYRLRQLNFPAK